MISLTIYEMTLYSVHFLKNSLIGYRILDWEGFPLSSLLKMSLHCLLKVMLWLEFTLHFYIFVLYGICLFFSSYFCNIFFIIGFNNLMWLYMVFFIFNLLGYLWVISTGGLIFSIFENILAFISSNVFLLHCLSPFLELQLQIMFLLFLVYKIVMCSEFAFYH